MIVWHYLYVAMSVDLPYWNIVQNCHNRNSNELFVTSPPISSDVLYDHKRIDTSLIPMNQITTCKYRNKQFIKGHVNKGDIKMFDYNCRRIMDSQLKEQQPSRGCI